MTASLTGARTDRSADGLRRAGWIALVVGVIGAALLLFGVTLLLFQQGCVDLREYPISGICVGPPRMILGYTVGAGTLALHTLGIGSAVILAVASLASPKRDARWRSIGLLIIAGLVGSASAVMTFRALAIDVDLSGLGFFPAIVAAVALLVFGVPWAIITLLADRFRSDVLQPPR